MKQEIRGGATSAAFRWKTLVATDALSLMLTDLRFR